MLTYDGTTDENSILVTVGTSIDDGAIAPPAGLTTVEVAGADRGVTVRFDVPPSDIGDAWISLDAGLEPRQLETTGVYRQTLTARGRLVLQAPVREQSTPC